MTRIRRGQVSRIPCEVRRDHAGLLLRAHTRSASAGTGDGASAQRWARPATPSDAAGHLTPWDGRCSTGARSPTRLCEWMDAWMSARGRRRTRSATSPARAPVWRAGDRAPTVVRVLHGSDGSYVGIRAFDAAPRLIRASELRRDADLTVDDYVTASHRQLSGQSRRVLLRTNPNGAMWDAQLTGFEDVNED